MVCDTNNFSHGADQIIIGNNKCPRSLGLIFYLITRDICVRLEEYKRKFPDFRLVDWRRRIAIIVF
jgi:ribosomal protein S2